MLTKTTATRAAKPHPSTPETANTVTNTPPTTTSAHNHSVAGVTHVVRSDPDAGRDIMASMKASATGRATRPGNGSGGTGSAGTRVKRLGMPRGCYLARHKHYDRSAP